MGCLRDLILRAAFGLLIGLGVGAVLGFVRFALGEKFFSRPGLIILAPSGALRVGMLGSVLMGIVGSVIGLITGVLGLRPLYAAAVGILLFALRNGRAVLSYLKGGRAQRQLSVMNLLDVTLFLDFALIGLLVAVLLRY